MDLGEELAGFGEPTEPGAWQSPGPGMPLGRLAHLQAQGFNRQPTHPGQVPTMWRESGVDYNDGGLISGVAVGDKPFWSCSSDRALLPHDRCSQCQRYLPGADNILLTPDAILLCEDCANSQARVAKDAP